MQTFTQFLRLTEATRVPMSVPGISTPLTVVIDIDVLDRHPIYRVFAGTEKVGYAKLSGDGRSVMDVVIVPAWQRRGIASALYDVIEQDRGIPLRPSPMSQSPAGKAFWRTRSTRLREAFEYWYVGPNPTVDLVVVRTSDRGPEILLIQRSGPVEAGKWALPGGFINTTAPRGARWQPGAETPREAALRELHEETGMDLRVLSNRLVPIGVYEGDHRDPRDTDTSWSQSHVFGVVVPASMPTRVQAQDDASAARWQPISTLPPLAFDHARIVRDAVRRLQVRVS